MKKQSPGTEDTVRGAKVGVGAKGNLTKAHPTPATSPKQAPQFSVSDARDAGAYIFRPEDILPERIRSPELSVEIAEAMWEAIAELKASGTRPTPMAIAIKVNGRFGLRDFTRDIRRWLKIYSLTDDYPQGRIL
jgi:hypothetical protein